MLIEELFARGTMTMGPSRHDPARQVGVFAPGLLEHLAARRAAEMEKFRWIEGSWTYENDVPASPRNPAYVDAGSQTFSLCDRETWVCAPLPDGSNMRQITFDPFSSQWIYALTRGSYGILRSADGWVGNQIVFTGSMTMIGIHCDWRMIWTRFSDDEFRFVNQERIPGGAWAHIDEWRFRRSR